MSAGQYPKRIKKKIYELKCEVHERELARELTKLAVKFDEWKADHSGAGALDHLIHQHHNGLSRELFKFYNYGRDDFVVAHAIVEGILTEDEISEDVWSYIESHVQFLRRE
ncbi:MAG: hypothetical protein K8S97_14875 [Anaerolineae bacterium]|nr:hypothetical protein [Anaerolineae bacterium]